MCVCAVVEKTNPASIARRHIRRKALEFDTADCDGDKKVGFDKFKAHIVPSGCAASPKEVLEWWSAIDYDGDSFIRKDDFFLYALCAASRKAGSGIAGLFRRYDSDGSGSLDEIEWEKALQEMGFGDVATAMFEEHAQVDKTISYLSLLKTVEARTSMPAMQSFLSALARDSRLSVDTSKWTFGGDTPEEARQGLVALLRESRVRLSDLFQHLDDDGSFTLTIDELHGAFDELGFTGPTAVVSAIFGLLDVDKSGKLGFDEFNAWVQGRKLVVGLRREDQVGHLSLYDALQSSVDAGDQSWSVARLRVELSGALASHGLRCIDLVKAWDKGARAGAEKAGDSLIHRTEFLIAMKKLCTGGTAGNDEELWCVRTARGDPRQWHTPVNHDAHYRPTHAHAYCPHLHRLSHLPSRTYPCAGTPWLVMRHSGRSTR